MRSADAARRPRLLVLNQYYWPGVEATAHLLSELCASLADEFEITVVTGRVAEGGPDRLTHEGVEIHRVPSTTFDRSRLWLRATNYLTYLGFCLAEALRVQRPDAILCMTDPPVIADVALVIARRFRVPLVVVSQDVFPEIAVELRRLESPLVVGTLRRAVRAYLERADCIVAIGETMARRLEAKGADAGRLAVISNWVDTEVLTPQPRDNAWAHEHGLEGRFVVMHSGNVGHTQNLDALIRAATFLRDLDDLSIVIVGAGARRDELVDLARLLETYQVRFMPYQPRQQLPFSLSAADVHVVGLSPRLAGFVVPSRLYGILAVAKPVIVAADAESETAQVVARVGCGVVVPPARPELLAGEIRRAYDGELDLEEMGRRGRDYVAAEADRRVAVDRYRSVLQGLLEGKAG